jgi:hypothetical protein
MKKAVLEKGNWRKIGKPKVVSRPGPALTGVATPAKPASQQSGSPAGQEATPAPRAMKVTQPRQGVGVPLVGPVVEGQRVEVAASTVESEPTNLRQTERIDEVKEMQTNTVVKPRAADGHYSNSPAVVIEEVSADEKAPKPRQAGRSEKLRSEPARRRTRDLQSGMELLGLDFMLSIVENTASDDDLDVTMRRLNFNELIRTDQLHAVDSNALKVYALNDDGHYDKHIQCEAIKELTARTAQGK